VQEGGGGKGRRGFLTGLQLWQNEKVTVGAGDSCGLDGQEESKAKAEKGIKIEKANRPACQGVKKNSQLRVRTWLERIFKKRSQMKGPYR